jgi:hypothetical protein
MYRKKNIERNRQPSAMKRWLRLISLISAVCLGLPAVSAAQSTSPALILKADCTGTQVNGVDVGVTGFPSNTPFTGTLTWDTGGIGPIVGGPLTTDSNGDFIIFFGLSAGQTVTWTVDSPYLPGGTQSATLVLTCEPTPTNIDQCKKGGYLRFNFSNQGQCVAFLQRGPEQ